MKKITKPSTREEYVYYSDFSGKCFGEHFPDVLVRFEFNYGSKYDGARLQLDLQDDESDELLEFIKKKLTPETKKEINRVIDNLDNQYDEACSARDWSTCELLSNDVTLLRSLLK